MNTVPLKERAQGRWRSILPALGVSSDFLRGKHGPCPLCREGKDRFRFDDKGGNGSWICSHCGAGDGTKLVMLVNGWEFKQAAIEIEKLIGQAPVQAARPAMSDDDVRGAKNALWRNSEPVTLATTAGRYLRSRTGLTTFSPCLRAVARLRYAGERSLFFPALVAMVTASNGTPATLHRTYLGKDGGKAPVEDPRRLMPGHVQKGSAVRLAEHAERLGIAEGIETAISATVLFGIPCWAAINSTLLSSWIPPEGVTEVTIFGDNDANYAGQAAAYTLAHRIARTDRMVKVELPPSIGTDWNDVWSEQITVAA